MGMSEEAAKYADEHCVLIGDYGEHDNWQELHDAFLAGMKYANKFLYVVDLTKMELPEASNLEPLDEPTYIKKLANG
jgi:hypothetical protein